MSVLVFVEIIDKSVKKSSLEALAYGSALAQKMGSSCAALAIGEADENELKNMGQYGISKVYHAADSQLNTPNIQAYSFLLTEAANLTNAEVIVAAKSSLADPVAARTAGKLGAGIVGNVTELPDLSNGFTVKHSIFTGKAFANTKISTSKKVLLIKKNTIDAIPASGEAVIESLANNAPAAAFDSKTLETVKASGAVSLPEADLVVSGGRGLKGPEHWQPLLDLAEALGAATACSKPVSDLDWRPHHEHVGQTGIKVSPNLYIACGISGAIQHLAGVNSSKVIVVINTDKDAPFFAAADYGIVGDAFEVLPKLTAAVKALK